MLLELARPGVFPREAEMLRKAFPGIPRLMTAVLLQACCDLQASAQGVFWESGRRVDPETTRDIYEEARAWFLSEDLSAFSFIEVCLVLGVRPRQILDRLGPYLCPALSGIRKPFDSRKWRFDMMGRSVARRMENMKRKPDGPKEGEFPFLALAVP